jgi:ribosome-binding factor A
VPGRRRERRAPSPYPRTARVNEVLREVVAETLERMADTDDRLRLLTVTAVDVTPDLSRATPWASNGPSFNGSSAVRCG